MHLNPHLKGKHGHKMPHTPHLPHHHGQAVEDEPMTQLGTGHDGLVHDRMAHPSKHERA